METINFFVEEIMAIVLLLFFYIYQQEDLKKTPKPTGCELALRYFDDIYSISRAMEKEEVIVVVACLGKGERQEMNQHRLYTVKTYLTHKNVPSQKLVLAEGHPTDSYGKLEFYFRGNRYTIITLDKNQEIPLGPCELGNPFPEGFYLQKHPKRKRSPSKE